MYVLFKLDFWFDIFYDTFSFGIYITDSIKVLILKQPRKVDPNSNA